MGEATNPYWELRIHPSQLYPEAFASTVQVSASNNAVTWEPLTSAHGLVMGDGSEPLTLRFPSNQSRYLKVDFENTTAQPGDRYYTVVDHLAVGGAPESQNALDLYFSAPGDDPQFGAAAFYTVHYAAQAFEAEDFNTVESLAGARASCGMTPNHCATARLS